MDNFFMVVLLGCMIVLYVMAAVMVRGTRELKINRQKMFSDFARRVQGELKRVLEDPGTSPEQSLGNLILLFEQLCYEYPKTGENAHLIEFLSMYYRQMLEENAAVVWRTREKHDKAKALVRQWIDMLKEQAPPEPSSDEDIVQFQQSLPGVRRNNDEATYKAMLAIFNRYQKQLEINQQQARIKRLSELISAVGIAMSVFFLLYLIFS